MFGAQSLTYLVYFMVLASAILAVEGLYLAYSRRRARRGTVNRRLGLMRNSGDSRNVLEELRKERGLTAEGDYTLPWLALNRLFLQSGIRGSFASFIGMFLIAGISLAIIVFMIDRSVLLSLMTGAAVGFALPAMVLVRMRSRRRARFAEQLPDALDIIVRSLRAGHPTPVSLALAGRELPDPIGSEFGIVADELTYGLDLETTMRNLLERVGLDELRLVVVSLAIHGRTGGNLAEILSNLAKVIRERFKLRRKIRAISSEGRWSAISLSLFPFGLFVVINLIAPTYFGDIWDHWIVSPLIFGMLTLMAVGDFIMYRMVNFDF
ncbi:type II secretion system F family protein [Microbaculum sp. FT89]|uniref:type II secretion system F family protein n=1 Tax=Microbaculum sp. FT89 TaxID=3447298 RepID=UPI003F52FDD5